MQRASVVGACEDGNLGKPVSELCGVVPERLVIVGGISGADIIENQSEHRDVVPGEQFGGHAGMADAAEPIGSHDDGGGL